MKLEEIIQQIESLRRFGKRTGREISGQMLDRLLRPEKGMSLIHIAGTNGKGSTAAILASLLAQKGLRVGLFTSPHLLHFRERIAIVEEGSKHYISDENILSLGQKLLEEMSDLSPTMFDLCFVMAILYFKQENCDFVILETGLGGSFDSTRAITETPLVSIITSIGYDHTAILGEELWQIAENKAGILQPGTFAILGPMEDVARRQILSHCERIPCALVTEKNALDIFAQRGLSRSDLALEGDYQLYNGACALLALSVLERRGTLPSFSEKEIFSQEKRGLAQVAWPGRMERIRCYGRNILIDGAHNPQGVHALARSLKQIYPDQKLTFVIGILADKDYSSMLDAILPLADAVVTVTVASERSLAGADLAALLAKKGVDARAADGVREALSLASQIAKDNPIIAFGSLYFIASLEAIKEGESLSLP